MDDSPVAITYGRVYNNEIVTFFVADMKDAKEIAKEFIKVIPDDPDEYVKDVNAWDGKASLVITHQDDDTFYFNATVCGFYHDTEDNNLDREEFEMFVNDFRVEDE